MSPMDTDVLEIFIKNEIKSVLTLHSNRASRTSFRVTVLRQFAHTKLFRLKLNLRYAFTLLSALWVQGNVNVIIKNLIINKKKIK